MQRREVYYSGHVQGVGFRFTAIRIASRYDITGYVRNTPDSGVQCVIEGEKKTIDAFLMELSQEMGGFIRETTQQTVPFTGSLGTFTVKY